jgi:hypothetical protein
MNRSESLHQLLAAALIGAALVLPTPARAQDSLAAGSTGRSTAVAIAVDAVVLVPAGVLWLMDHELGHLTMASIAGAKNPRMGIWKEKPEGGFMLGWTEWDNQLSNAGTAATSIGGVVFTRGLAEGVDLLTSNVRIPSWLQPFMAMTFTLGRFDFARYVLFDALHNIGGSPGSDIDAFVTAVAGEEGFGRVLTYGALLTIATLDLVWDWERVSVYGHILGGDDCPYPAGGSKAHISVAPCVVGGRVGVHASFSW